MSEVVGRRLKEFRERAGITQVTLSKNTGLTQSMISAYETGERRLNEDALNKIAQALQCTPADLLSMAELSQPSCGAWGADKVHRLPVRVYYEDTDFSGIVYHARYLHFFERGRTESLRALGIHHSELIASEDPIAFAVRSMQIDWIAPAKVDDALIVETLYRPNRGPRLIMGQAIKRGEQTLCAAELEAVIIDPNGRPKRPPKFMIEAWTPVLTQNSD